MAQILDQVAEHLVGTRRIGAGEVLRAGQRVVEEVGLDLRMQQVEAGHGELLLGRGLRGGVAFVAAALGDAAGDGAGDRVGVLEVGAVVDAEPVAPCTAFRLADQGDAAGAVDGRDRGEDLVARVAEPLHRVEATQGRLVAVGDRAQHLRSHLQAVACALDVLRARQFADGGIEQVEGLACLERNLDLAALAVAQAFLLGAGDQAHPAQVRERAGHDQAEGDEGEQHHRQFKPADEGDLVVERRQQDERESPGDGDAGDEEDVADHGGSRGVVGCGEG